MKDLSVGVLLCLAGSVSLVEFFHHLDIFYIDIEEAIRLGAYLVIAIPSILLGVPLVVNGLQKVENS